MEWVHFSKSRVNRDNETSSYYCNILKKLLLIEICFVSMHLFVLNLFTFNSHYYFLIAYRRIRWRRQGNHKNATEKKIIFLFTWQSKICHKILENDMYICSTFIAQVRLVNFWNWELRFICKEGANWSYDFCRYF